MLFTLLALAVLPRLFTTFVPPGERKKLSSGLDAIIVGLAVLFVLGLSG